MNLFRRFMRRFVLLLLFFDICIVVIVFPNKPLGHVLVALVMKASFGED